MKCNCHIKGIDLIQYRCSFWVEMVNIFRDNVSRYNVQGIKEFQAVRKLWCTCAKNIELLLYVKFLIHVHMYMYVTTLRFSSCCIFSIQRFWLIREFSSMKIVSWKKWNLFNLRALDVSGNAQLSISIFYQYHKLFFFSKKMSQILLQQI